MRNVRERLDRKMRDPYLMRFFSRVNSSMSIEGTGCTESFPTDIANVRFLSWKCLLCMKKNEEETKWYVVVRHCRDNWTKNETTGAKQRLFVTLSLCEKITKHESHKFRSLDCIPSFPATTTWREIAFFLTDSPSPLLFSNLMMLVNKQQ